MTGFDLGLVNSITGDFSGVQWGIVALTEGNFLGWQAHFVNVNNGFLMDCNPERLIYLKK